jgi:alpha-D-xyloside xylohydrolase
MRYKLMPYIYAQAKFCSEKGLPMLRALFIEYPGDAGAWNIEDEYLFGADILVAPFLQDSTYEREVYLPGGKWINYQSGEVYEKGWHHLKGGNVPIVILVRDGAVIPHARLAQSTKDIDWNDLQLTVYSTDHTAAKGMVYLPSDSALHEIDVNISNGKYSITNDPYRGKMKWTIRSYQEESE